EGRMQGSVFKAWYGSKRFTIAMTIIIVVLIVTLAVAIYSYISAFTALSNFSYTSLQASLLRTSSRSATATPIERSSNSVSEENDSTMKTTGPSQTKSTRVTVNGTPIPVPDKGDIHKEVESTDGTARVDIRIHSDTNGETKNHSNIRFNLHSSTTNTG